MAFKIVRKLKKKKLLLHPELDLYFIMPFHREFKNKKNRSSSPQWTYDLYVAKTRLRIFCMTFATLQPAKASSDLTFKNCYFRFAESSARASPSSPVAPAVTPATGQHVLSFKIFSMTHWLLLRYYCKIPRTVESCSFEWFGIVFISVSNPYSSNPDPDPERPWIRIPAISLHFL